MPPTSVPISVEELIFSLASGIGEQQARLDQDYRERLALFLIVLKAAQASGHEPRLAREIAPLALVLNGTEIEVKFRGVGSFAEGSAIKIQPLDVGFMRRYAYSGFAQNSLRWRVERIPGAPESIRTR